MKIESSLPAMQVVTSGSSQEQSKNLSSRQSFTQTAPVKTAEISRPDTNFRSKSLAINSALAGTTDGPVSNNKASSSSVVSKQAAPYLSNDEVNFFEGVIRQRTPNYGAYTQSSPKVGTSLNMSI